MILILLQHVVACIWVYIGRFDEGSKDNWIYQKGYLEMQDLDLYITSFYFTVTTIMTVGYGDITAYSMMERLLCILLMLIGVVAFSFATGAISSIITNQDSVDAKLREKLATL
jgi:Ion channel